MKLYNQWLVQRKDDEALLCCGDKHYEFVAIDDIEYSELAIMLFSSQTEAMNKVKEVVIYSDSDIQIRPVDIHLELK